MNLEERVTTCWSPEVRPLAAEAYRCYSTGSARASIVLTWTAVCADVIEKLRRLAEDGDGTAAGLVAKVEQVQGKDDAAAIRTMQDVESQLLTTAADLELIDSVERRKLDQLRLDRNLCAHPSLRPLGDLFAPSLDDARAHLAVALDSLLTQQPSQGRKVIERFRAHVDDPSFAGSEGFIAHSFFDTVKPAVRRKIVNLAVKHALVELVGDGSLSPDQLAERMAICVTAFAARDRSLVREEMKSNITRLAGQRVDVQLRAIGRVGELDAFWEATDAAPALLEQFDRCIADIQAPLWGQRLAPQEIAVLSLVSRDQPRALLPALSERFQTMPDFEKATIIGRRPGRFFGPYLAQLLAGAGSFRGAEALCHQAVLPCAQFLLADQLRAVLEAWAENGECREASAMPEYALSLYLLTKERLPATAVWRGFVQRARELSPDKPYYHYDQVAALLPPEDGSTTNR
ncbi:hypothetical protein [Streptomyces mirabilis]